MRRALLLAALVPAALLAGCADPEGATRETLVPYPRMGDEAVYDVAGSYVELARWENGHAVASAVQVRFRVQPSEPVLDASRAAVDVFRVAVDLQQAGGRARHGDLFVSPAHEAVVQALYPLTTEQAIVSFDQRGFPWLFGASALFGQDVAQDRRIPATVPDTLGSGSPLNLTWRSVGREDVAGQRATKLVLEGNASVEGAVWIGEAHAWPLKATLVLRDASIEPLLRVDGDYPVRMEARLASLTPGQDAVPPRNRMARFAEDAAIPRDPWDGFAPPDGAGAHAPYLLSEALRDAQLLDLGLRQWLEAADDPRLYRATFKEMPGPSAEATNATWLLQFVDRGEQYYGVQMGRLQPKEGALPEPPVSPPVAPPAGLPGVGAPRVESSGPAEPPASSNHGWFARDAVPGRLVPLSAAVQVVQQVFGANRVEIFLRSFAEPPGYSYFLDGGWDGEKGEGGRYTVVYDPNTGLLQQATGHGVKAMMAKAG